MQVRDQTCICSQTKPERWGESDGSIGLSLTFGSGFTVAQFRGLSPLLDVSVVRQRIRKLSDCRFVVACQNGAAASTGLGNDSVP